MLLEAFSKAFIELRKGTEQFGSEMAVRVSSQRTPLGHAGQVHEVLAYLLDWRLENDGRIEELTSAFVDIMVHQVALLNGIMEGVKGLLQRLGPENIDRDLAKRGGAWPFRARARWNRFVERHRELLEESRQLASTIFGPEFARAYAMASGERFEGDLTRSPPTAMPGGFGAPPARRWQ
jgi:type VI secretion system protein